MPFGSREVSNTSELYARVHASLLSPILTISICFLGKYEIRGIWFMESFLIENLIETLTLSMSFKGVKRV
jgi:hypothetical protein